MVDLTKIVHIGDRDMADLTKIVHIGRGNAGEVFCKIKLSNGRLSITGVEGPLRDGDCKGACGQIVMLEWRMSNYATGWNAELVTRFREVWERWHLNDMRAGSPAQEAFIRTWRAANQYEYAAACAALKEAGLYDDNGYKYGMAWKTEEIPAEVIELLASLPETEITPAWV